MTHFINTTTGEYPVSAAQLRGRHPDTLFPDGYALAFRNYAPVQIADHPAFNPNTHKAVAQVPESQAGKWVQRWSVVPLTQQEQEEARRASIPQSCSPAQGLVALFALKSITEGDLNAAIELIADPVQRYTARVGFQRATEWRRNSATMQQMARMLSLTESDLDALFAYAVTVNV